MDPAAIIASYVDDVVGRLPRRQRNDVGFELRSLLTEELGGRAADAGRPADDAMALEILRGFGRPQDVADRYRPAGFVIIPPAEASRFAAIALGGVILQWALSLPAFLSRSPLEQIGVWWLTWGLGAFWWPGFMVTMAIVAGWIRHRRGEAETWTPPRALDRDRVSRPGLVAALGFWIAGMSVMIALPWLDVLLPGLPAPLLAAFAFDPDFMPWRAVWALPLWAGHFAVYAAVLTRGRWGRGLRLVSLTFNLAWLALMTWWVAGPVFISPAADGVVKLSLVGIILLTLLDLGLTLRREMSRVRTPAL